MHDRAEAADGKKRHAGLRWLLVGCGGLFATFLAVGFGYLAWANSPFPPLDPPPPLPDPNGRDACVAALANHAAPNSQSPFDRPDTSPLAEVRRAVARPDPAADKIRAALPLEYRNPEEFDFNASFPELLHYRELIRRWTLEARLAREAGQPAKALEHCLDAMELGSRIPHGGGLIHHLVGIACQIIPLYQAERAIPELSVEEARQAGTRLDRIIRQNPDLSAAVEIERRAGLAAVRAIFSSGGDTSALTGASSPALPHPMMMSLYPKPWTYRNLESFYRQSLAEARKPYPARTWPEVPRDPFCAFLLPDFNPTARKLAERDAALRLLCLELALHEYRSTHGQYPSTLESLGTLPTELRTDPFTNTPFVYRATQQGYVLYSLGHDGADDGGVPIANRNRSSKGPGDIVAGKLKKEQ